MPTAEMQCKLLKCTYCLQKLSDAYVACSECPLVKLCIDCFLSGAEGGKHQNSHNYSFESLSFDTINGLFPANNYWLCEEDVKLLTAVENYGFGNWNEIALYLGTRSAADCKKHYEQFYIHGVIGQQTAVNLPVVSRTTDHTPRDSFPPLTHRVCELRCEEQKALGYMPHRDDYEYEFHNDAEKILITVPYGAVDSLEYELQLALVDIYNRHLRERALRHSVANEHGLVTYLLRDLILSQAQSRPNHTFRSYGNFKQKPDKRSMRRRSYRWSLPYSQKRNRLLLGTSMGAGKLSLYTRVRNRKPSKHLPNSVIETLEAITCDPVQLSQISISNVHPNACSVSAAIPAPDSESLGHSTADCTTLTSNPASILDYTKWQQTFTQTLCDIMEPYLTTCRRSKGVSLDVPNDPHSVHFPYCLNPCACSTAASDSGIGSLESCAQSTISTSSINGDPFTRTSSSTVSADRLALVRRPRSNSDSVYCSSYFIGIHTRSLDSFSSLRDLRLQSDIPSSLAFSREPSRWNLDKKHTFQCCNQPPPTVALCTQPETVKRRRGRPPRAKTSPLHDTPGISARGKEPVSAAAYSTLTSWIAPFLRFMTHREAENLKVYLKREHELRSELLQLKSHHDRGVRRLDEVKLQPCLAFTPSDGCALLSHPVTPLDPHESVGSKRSKRAYESRRLSATKPHPKRNYTSLSKLATYTRSSASNQDSHAPRPRGRPRKQLVEHHRKVSAKSRH
ncbi:hypothetical protein EG68_00737 [Paragonimus skrjabini miyazakii]|uniref:Transcriptional adapter 2-beta n=1 Tax=Paragonimus skrjabini miyazakii TaxID=59628 RepID=A0A8S9Z9J0_9TREM|nr:hypothetical protein EG68_00737 [Paragonimus skrjabini miyazakii]